MCPNLFQWTNSDDVSEASHITGTDHFEIFCVTKSNDKDNIVNQPPSPMSDSSDESPSSDTVTFSKQRTPQPYWTYPLGSPQGTPDSKGNITSAYNTGTDFTLPSKK